MVGKSSTHATRSQVVAINKKLEEVLQKRTDGTFEYKEGWDDQKVGEEFSVSKNSVAGIRTELFGKLFYKSADSRLQTHIDTLQRRVDEITEKYNKLIVTLALNKVADIKHLKLSDPQKAEPTK